MFNDETADAVDTAADCGKGLVAFVTACSEFCKCSGGVIFDQKQKAVQIICVETCDFQAYVQLSYRLITEKCLHNRLMTPK